MILSGSTKALLHICIPGRIIFSECINVSEIFGFFRQNCSIKEQQAIIEQTAQTPHRDTMAPLQTIFLKNFGPIIKI